MGRVRVVVPGVEHIEISDGDWIEIKKQLNTGDAKRLEGAGLKPPLLIDGRIITPIDWGLYEIERACIWLVDWSLVGLDGAKMPINVASIQSLDPDTFKEIDKAILAYVKAQDEEKKSKTPTANPKPIGDESTSEPTS